MSLHPVDRYVGQKLKSKRTMMGMSQDDLGKAVGVTFQQIQKYEKGSNRMGCSRLYEISKILETPIPFFFEGLDNSFKNNALEEEKIMIEDEYSKESLYLNRAFKKINDPQIRKKVVELVRSLANEE